MSGHPNCVGHGLAAVRAVHLMAPDAPLNPEDVGEEQLADVIADVLHLAVAAGLDPYEVLDHARRYFHGDLTDPAHDEPTTAPAEELTA